MYRVMKSEPQTSSLKEHFKRRTFDMYMVRPRRLWEHPVLFIVSTCTSPLAHRGDCRYPSSCSFVLILDVQLLWYPELFNHNIGDIFKLFENQGLSNCGVIFRVILTHVSIHRNLRDVLNAEMLFTCQIILIVPPMSFLMSDNEFCTEQHHEHGFGNRTISAVPYFMTSILQFLAVISTIWSQWSSSDRMRQTETKYYVSRLKALSLPSLTWVNLHLHGSILNNFKKNLSGGGKQTLVVHSITRENGCRQGTLIGCM